ncbi:hypothetical protein ABZ281_15310 [Streptomyces sp. NPDC006265]|uniref:hypothetical protein n=1 Tax=Streptomyces sp. NPDC006265 TaxID=3156740 RepID=UPI0033AC3C25
MSEIRDVMITGSGPGGHTALTQLSPLLFGSSVIVGGSLTTTTGCGTYGSERFPRRAQRWWLTDPRRMSPGVRSG